MITSKDAGMEFAKVVRDTLVARGLPCSLTVYELIKGRVGIGIAISLDQRDTWINGIFENSRHSKFMFSCDTGKLEQISGHKVNKFRKATIKTDEDVARKLLAWIDSHG
jgi:hypothetical protein